VPVRCGEDAARGGAWRRVDGRLVPTLVGVAIPRRGAPYPVVSGEN